MRCILTMLCLVCIYPFIIAQQVKVYGGGQMTLSAGSPLVWSGLTLTPASNFNITSSLDQSGTATNSFPSAFVQRVFRFDPATTPFNGSIRIQYLDGELNGLDENTLQLFVNNGTSWIGFPTGIADPSQNYVQADVLSSPLLGELLLSSSSALPLKWGQASISREQDLIRIRWSTEQEKDVSHFDIERSTDAHNWRIAITGIQARNQPTVSNYEATDRPNTVARLFYRIRQTDIDGRFSFSKILVAPAISETGQLNISPNPAKGFFLLTTTDVSKLASVYLINSGGQVMHTWKGGQNQYQLPAVTAGNYIVRIQFTDGSYQTRKLQIK